MEDDKIYEIASDECTPNSSSASQTTRLTPESDSDDSDLDLNRDELSHGIELHQRDSEKAHDTEHLDIAGDDDEPRLGRRGSISTRLSDQLYTPDEERAVVRKFDRKLVCFVALLYMLSFLDRSSMCPGPALLPLSRNAIYCYITPLTNCRYWQCSDCRSRERPQSQLLSV
jgi:hypothetical protein